VRHDQKIVMSSCSDDPQQGPKAADGPGQPRQARQAVVRNAIKLPTLRPGCRDDGARRPTLRQFGAANSRCVGAALKSAI
jgi:hypothetical protein